MNNLIYSNGGRVPKIADVHVVVLYDPAPVRLPTCIRSPYSRADVR